jgi:hypothetical protein
LKPFHETSQAIRRLDFLDSEKSRFYLMHKNQKMVCSNMFLTILKNHPNSALIRSWKKKPSGKERLRLLPTSVAPMFCLGFSLSFLFFLDSFFLFVFLKGKEQGPNV